ncbi:MAG: LysR family transcriptional regulator [Pirellulales bacterium]
MARMFSSGKNGQRILSHRKPSPSQTSDVDLQSIRYAVAAAGHGSFRRVSEVLMLRQSALSRCISQLEHSLGMTDFERSSGGVQATTVGRDFLRTVCG